MTDSIDQILVERGKQYGDFTTHAEITYRLKRDIRSFAAGRTPDMTDVHWEALDMIIHKIGRILNGNPNHRDSWDDIAGYAKLAADRCKP